MPNIRKENRKQTAQTLFVRGSDQWRRGAWRSAFRLFLMAAKYGEAGAQLNLGYFYDKGIGVQHDRHAAMYWYKRAYRRGESGAANNIATIWRDEGKMDRALLWFRKAVALGDEGANLEIAKHYLHEGNPAKAINLIKRVCDSHTVAETEIEEARQLLKRARRDLVKHP